ncbi:MAG: zinc-binding dehydrogenase [Planctomycetales bacterium]|nr:zinc-binding dehydrogenase [Planctomycetales bacterium]
MSQRAVVNYGPEPHSVELRDIDDPTPGADDVIMEVQAVGVCGSDLHMWTGHQSWTVEYPMVLGHEFSGIIRQVGSNVTDWQVGDRVVSETHARVNMNSPMSRRGLYNLDPNRGGYGAAVNGAMTRIVKVPSRILHRMPDSLSFEVAALTEPCCVAFNATVLNGSITPGDRVVVLGPGPIGILSAAMARLCGAEVAVVGLERDRERLAVTEQYGCETLTSGVEDWAREVDGLGADGVIDATGVSVALQMAMNIVRPAGWISKVGWGPQPLNFSLDPLVQKNIRLQGSFSHNWPIWERIIRLLSTGQLDVRPIIGGRWQLEQWHDAFETMHSGKIVKAVLTPNAR